MSDDGNRSVDYPPDRPTQPSRPTGKASTRDPVRRWTIVVAGILLLLLALQIISDRTAPVTSIATVEGLVLPISPRVSGELTQVPVSDNETVEAGALLAQIDPTPFQLAVEAAEADLLQVGQSIGVSTAEVAVAQARVNEAEAELANTRAQAERTLTLVARGVVTAANGDDASASIATGEAKLAAVQADLRRAERALGPEGADNPQLRAAQAALDTAQFNLSQTRIVAPTLGRIVNLGVGPSETALEGQPILTLIDLRGGWITAWFRENQIGNMAVGDRAEVVLDVLPGKVVPARVVSFSAAIDTINQAATPGGLINIPAQQTWMKDPQRFAVRLEFDPPDRLPPHVRLGSQATVMVYTSHRTAMQGLWKLLIRARAILTYAH